MKPGCADGENEYPSPAPETESITEIEGGDRSDQRRKRKIGYCQTEGRSFHGLEEHDVGGNIQHQRCHAWA